MRPTSLPAIQLDSNQKTYRITKGISIKSERNSKKKIAVPIYLVEEYQNNVWVLMLAVDATEDNREAIIKHIAYANKVEDKKTYYNSNVVSNIDAINAEIDDLEAQLIEIIEEIESPSKPKEEEVRRKGAKTK